MFYYKQRTIWSEMVRALAQIDDVRALPVLVNMLENDRGRRTLNDFSPRVEPLLIRLLRRIEPKDMPVLQGLSEAQRQCLLGELKGGNAKLILAILHALVQAGDGTAIGYVAPLAQGAGLAAVHEQIKQAAQQCLSVLRARTEQAEAELKQWQASRS